MLKPRLLVSRLRAEARLPTRATPGSAGLDLYACLPDGPLAIEAGERTLVPTGLQIGLPDGFEGQVRPRSGLALRQGLTVLNAPGTIDSDYRGELSVLLVNLGQAPVTVMDGDRIAQLVVAPVTMCEPALVLEIPPSSRGQGGFGSTGR